MTTYRYEAYHNGEWIEKPEKDWVLWYGDLKESNDGKDDELYVLPRLLSGGDYASSTLAEKSNQKVFLERHGKKDGVHEVSGGYGSYGVAIRKDVYESDEDIKSDLGGLGDYPLLDEEEHSRMEFDAEREALEGWAKSDIDRMLRKELDGLVDDPDEIVDGIEDIGYLFEQARMEANEYWMYESGGMWIDISKMTPYMIDRVLVEVTHDEMLPTLVGREWKSDEAKERFQERLNNG